MDSGIIECASSLINQSINQLINQLVSSQAAIIDPRINFIPARITVTAIIVLQINTVDFIFT